MKKQGIELEPKRVTMVELAIVFPVRLLVLSRQGMDYGTSFKLQKFNQAADLEACRKNRAGGGMR
jgi:hypothetical protein